MQNTFTGKPREILYAAIKANVGTPKADFLYRVETLIRSIHDHFNRESIKKTELALDLTVDSVTLLVEIKISMLPVKLYPQFVDTFITLSIDPQLLPYVNYQIGGLWSKQTSWYLVDILEQVKNWLPSVQSHRLAEQGKKETAKQWAARMLGAL